MPFVLRKIRNLLAIFSIAIVICSIYSRLTLAPTHNPENSELIKSIWLSHVGNALLTYTNTTDNAFNQLSRLNYNRVYVDVYNAGTTYSSKYAPRNYLLSLPFTNPLKTAITQGKRQGLKIYAWYEHGLMTFANDELAQRHPDWILTTANNEKLIDNHWWIDPANSEVREYFINLFTEVALSYPDLYGIQVDDHWGIPIQFGDYTEAVTELTREVMSAVRKARPNLVISVSPNPLGFSRRKYSLDWLTWINEGLVDELVMQLYRPTNLEVALAIDNSILPQIRNTVDVAVGIYAGGLFGQKPLAEIQQQMSVVKQYGYGYALFPWKTSLGILRRASRQEKENYLKAV